MLKSKIFTTLGRPNDLERLINAFFEYNKDIKIISCKYSTLYDPDTILEEHEDSSYFYSVLLIYDDKMRGSI
jgi:hypothetical protein